MEAKIVHMEIKGVFEEIRAEHQQSAIDPYPPSSLKGCRDWYNSHTQDTSNESGAGKVLTKEN